MEWKQLVESDDLIVFEKRFSSKVVRVEARLTEGGWEIIKKHDFFDIDYVEEYYSEYPEETHRIINLVLTEKDLSKQEVIKLKSEQRKKASVQIKRLYKDGNHEKWVFSINNGIVNNHVLIHYDDPVEMDIVMNDDYKHLEKSVVKEVLSTLGLDENYDVHYGVYFYTKRRSYLLEVEPVQEIREDKGRQDKPGKQKKG